MTGISPRGTLPRGALPGTAYRIAPVSAATPLSAPFFVLEMETYQPSTVVQSYDLGRGSHPRGTLAKIAAVSQSTGHLYASDVGYVGPRIYPPILDTAFDFDVETTLDPHTSAGGYSFGSVTITNANRLLDSMAAVQNDDCRPMRVLTGRKAWDASRGIFVDPPYDTLAPVFAGVGTPWSLDDTLLTCPIRDPSYWIENAVQTALYAGTNAYEGNAALAGLPKPKARGGTSVNPIQNITPVLIDPVALIYQWTDYAGTIVHLYEGCDGSNIIYDGDVQELYGANAPAPGHYRTSNARGCFQLGSKPVQQITADVTGSFATATVSTLFQLVLHMLTDDLGLPTQFIDVGAFMGADFAYPYTAGLFLGTAVADGATLIGQILASVGAQLVPTRDGRVRPFVLRGEYNLSAAASYTTSNTISVVPVALPKTLYPPPYRWRVGWGHNYTTQTSGLLPNATASRVQFAAQPDQYASWSNASILTAWRRPTDPAPLPGVLLASADAAAVAAALGALWGIHRKTYDVTVPIALGIQREIGDAVVVAWPMDDLMAGRLGQVVGIKVRAYDAVATLRILL